MLRGFTKKKVNSLTLGEQLKKIRSEGRITLSEISRDTKIPIKYLTMIEEGDYKSLPPDVYVKGFLKSYAEYLGVEPQKLINLYQRERDIKSHLGKDEKKNVPRETAKPPRFVITPKMITVAAIALVILGGFFYLYKEIGRFAAVPRLVITEPAGDRAIDGNSITVTGFTDPDAKLTINDQPVLVNDNGEFKEDILLQEGLNTININAVNRFNKTTSESINISSNYQKPDLAYEKPEDSGQVNGEQDKKNENVRLTVRIDANPTWLSIESDGDLIYSGTMLAGATQDFTGEREIRITSGKANQTFIRVNGKAERVLADTPGIVRDVVFGLND